MAPREGVAICSSDAVRARCGFSVHIRSKAVMRLISPLE